MPETNYDIFISFKDRDSNSNRTVASRLAEDIYDTLDVKGYRVFYSRYVLPGMVGGEYEPVINRALETAKLLVLVFSNSEEVNSEWVKYEWKYFSKHNKPILTVFKDCGNAKLENLPFVISKLQYCDLTEGSERQYEFMLKRIAEIMSPDASSIPSPKKEKQKPDRQPAANQSAPEPKPKIKSPPKPESNSNPKQVFSHPIHQTQPVSNPTPQPASRKNVRVGGKVIFGSYPQGANGEVEPLVWRVLAVERGKALLITDKLIDYVKYNKTFTKVTWETCTLRKWMNNDFINRAFSSSQRFYIATVTNQNPNNPIYVTKGGNVTQDEIFALSIDEANQYFTTDGDRKAYTTDYAHKKRHDFKDRSEWWWLRSPGYYGNSAANVDNHGYIYQGGGNVSNIKVAVRPAFWLNL